MFQYLPHMYRQFRSEPRLEDGSRNFGQSESFNVNFTIQSGLALWEPADRIVVFYADGIIAGML